MGLVVNSFLFAVCVAIGILTIFLRNNETKKKTLGVAVLYFGIASVFILFTVLYLAPKQLGYSRVPTSAEKYADRLNSDVVYQLIGADKDGEDQILTVKQYCVPSDYRAIRVKATAPPVATGKQFALVNGNPVEIVLPSDVSPCDK